MADFFLGGNLGIFSKKKKKSNVAYDPYGKTREAFQNWLVPQIGKSGKKYTGQMVAPMSDAEKDSFGFLRQYGEQGFGQPFQQAKNEISKTFTGEYDPSKSPYYQAVKAQASRNLSETQKNIGSNAAGAGRFWSGGRLAEQADASKDMGNSLNRLLGEMSERERQNRLSIIPQAIQMGEMEQRLPLQQAQAYQSLGALPREIQQAIATAQQQDWLRSEVDYPMDIGRLAANVQTPPTYQQKQQGWLSKLMGSVGRGVGNYAGEKVKDWADSKSESK